MMRNETDVIRAGIEDIPEPVRMRLAYLNEDHGSLDQRTEEQIKDELPVCFAKHLNSDLLAYVIKEGERLICTAFLLIIEKPMSPSFINGKTGTVLNVYTEPSFRRKGYARKVMQALINDAKDMNLCVIDLKATKDGLPLYRLLGFEEDINDYTAMKYRF